MNPFVKALRRLIGTQHLETRLDGLESALEKQFKRLAEQNALETKWRSHMVGKMDALLRAQYLSEFLGDDYPFAANARRFKLFSQNEEDGIVLALLQTAGVVNRNFVEIGSGGSGGNSGMLSAEFGWRGVMVDYNPDNVRRAKNKFGANPNCSFDQAEVTPENVNDLITRHGLAGEVDFFSLDIDSFDYWVLEAMTACSPRVMCLEYNSYFGPDASVTIGKDTDLSKAPKGFHGVSLRAYVKLAEKKGYRLLGCDPTGINAFFLRNDLRPEIKAVDPGKVFTNIKHRKDPLAPQERDIPDLFAMARDIDGLSIVEV